MEKTIKIKIKLGIKDMYHFLLQYNYKSFSGLFGLFISLFALGYLAFTHDSHETPMNLILLFIGLLWTVIQPLLLLQKAAQQVVNNQAYKEMLEYEFDDRGLKICQGKEVAEVSWENIVKVKEDRKQILLFTSRVHACILPKAQFQEELDAVKVLIQEKTKK